MTTKPTPFIAHLDTGLSFLDQKAKVENVFDSLRKRMRVTKVLASVNLGTESGAQIFLDTLLELSLHVLDGLLRRAEFVRVALLLSFLHFFRLDGFDKIDFDLSTFLALLLFLECRIGAKRSAKECDSVREGIVADSHLSAEHVPVEMTVSLALMLELENELAGVKTRNLSLRETAWEW